MSQTIAPVLAQATVQELREAVWGVIVLPGDDGYVDAARAWNGAFDARTPAIIVSCAGGADVIAAVGFARGNGLTVAVRGGGHSVAGFSTSDGGIGWAMRKFGLACDNLVAADVVTADGRLVHASETENSEPLWGCAAVAATSASSRGSSSRCIRSDR